MISASLLLLASVQSFIPKLPEGVYIGERFDPGTELREVHSHTSFSGGLGEQEFSWRGTVEIELRVSQVTGFLRARRPGRADKNPAEHEFVLGPLESIVLGGLSEGEWRVQWEMEGRLTSRFFDVRRGERGTLELVGSQQTWRAEPEVIERIPLLVSLSRTDGKIDIGAAFRVLDANGVQRAQSSLLRDSKSNAEGGRAWRPGLLQTENGGCVTHIEDSPGAGLEIGKLAPGSYTLIASRLGHEDVSQEFEIRAGQSQKRLEVKLPVRGGAPFFGGRSHPGLGWSELYSPHEYCVAVRDLPPAEMTAEDRTRRFEALPVTGPFEVLDTKARWLEPGLFEFRLSSTESVDVYVGPVRVGESHGATWVRWYFDRPGEAAGIRVLGPLGMRRWVGWIALSIDRGQGFEPLPGKAKWDDGKEARTWIHGVPKGRIGVFGDPERTLFLGAFQHDGKNVNVNLTLEKFVPGSPQVIDRRQLETLEAPR